MGFLLQEKEEVPVFALEPGWWCQCRVPMPVVWPCALWSWCRCRVLLRDVDGRVRLGRLGAGAIAGDLHQMCEAVCAVSLRAGAGCRGSASRCLWQFELSSLCVSVAAGRCRVPCQVFMAVLDLECGCWCHAAHTCCLLSGVLC